MNKIYKYKTMCDWTAEKASSHGDWIMSAKIKEIVTLTLKIFYYFILLSFKMLVFTATFFAIPMAWELSVEIQRDFGKTKTF